MKNALLLLALLVLFFALVGCARKDWERCIFEGKWQSFCEGPVIT